MVDEETGVVLFRREAAFCTEGIDYWVGGMFWVFLVEVEEGECAVLVWEGN